MTFGQSITHCFRNYATWQGRAGRAEYWWWYLFSFIVQIPFLVWYVIAIVAASATISASGGASDPVAMGALASVFVPIIIMCVIALALILPSLAVAIRRLHDQDKSGGWYWMVFIPSVGGIILLVFMLLPGTPGANRFGEAAARA